MDIKRFATEICESFAGKPVEDPERYAEGTGYYILTSCIVDTDTLADSCIEVVRYARPDGSPYFGIHHYVDTDYCDAICDPDWEYTDDCSEEALVKALQYLSGVYAPEEMQKMYDTYKEKENKR